MCNQTAALVARTLEEFGISTICICLLREIMEKVPPPRSLFVPFGFGNPLGAPNAPELQHQILQACMEMLVNVEEPGTIVDFEDWVNKEKSHATSSHIGDSASV